MATMIDLFNSTISDAINKDGDFYKVLIGESDYTPGVTILTSDDINCGALCNELEFARLQCQGAVEAFDVSLAVGDILDLSIETYIDLPRRGSTEGDSDYLDRFRAIVSQNVNPRRHTRWAIIDAILEFGIDPDRVQIIELFDSTNEYFEVRFTSEMATSETLFLDNYITNGFLDQYYVGGFGIGFLEVFMSAIVSRIKAAGVDFEIFVIARGEITKTSDAQIV